MKRLKAPRNRRFSMRLFRNFSLGSTGGFFIDPASPGSAIKVADESLIQGKKVLVVEDGPTLTHGGMAYGVGIVAAERYRAAEIVDPRPYVVGSIKNVLASYPHIKNLVPAMGYSSHQIKELEDTINNTPCDLVLIATPIDLTKIIKINKPTVRISYEIEEIGKPTIADAIERFLKI